MPSRVPNLNPVVLPDPPPEIARWVDYVISAFEFSPRERIILRRLLKGESDPEIAQETGLSIGTIRAVVGSLYQRTSTHGRAELMAFVMGTL